MLEKYETLPVWLRWLLLLPLSITFMLLVVLLTTLLNLNSVLMHPTFAIVSLAFALYSLAPKWKAKIVMASVIIRMIAVTGFIIFIFSHGGVTESRSYLELLGELIGWAAGWSVAIFLFKDDGFDYNNEDAI